jgi:hypothetical protein
LIGDELSSPSRVGFNKAYAATATAAAGISYRFA